MMLLSFNTHGHNIVSNAHAKKKAYFLSVVLILIAILAFFAKYVFNVLLTHVLPAGSYGSFSVGLKMFVLFSALLPLGSAVAAKRFLSKYINQKDEDQASSYIRWNFYVLLIASVIFLLVLAGVIGILKGLQIFDGRALSSYHIVFYLMFLSPLGAFALLLGNYLQCNNNIVFYNIVSQMGKYFFYILTMLLTTYVLKLVYNYDILWTMTLSVFCCVSLLAILLLAFLLPGKIFQKVCSWRRTKTPSVRDWRTTSFHLAINQVLFFVLMAVDLLVAKILVADSARVDQYAAVIMLASFAWVISVSIYSVLPAQISSHIEKTQTTAPEILQGKINQVNIINLLLTLLLGTLAIVFSRPIIGAFGPTYYNAVSQWAFIILVVGYLLGGFSRPAAAVIAYSGNEMWMIYLSIGELIMITVTAVVLTLLYGIVGTAIAAAGTILVKTVVLLLISHYKVGVRSVGFF
jgi:O-antigen/teichoic acid export membrane protein